MTELTPVEQDAVFRAFPGVPIDRDNIAHYHGLLQRRLLVNRCDDCGYWILPHRPLCPRCWSWQVTPTEVSGDGKVFLYTIIHQPRDPQATAFEPVPVAAIELAEQPGLRYLGAVVDCPVDAIALDMAVRLVWIDRGGQARPAFMPVGEA